jgi:hypothetical protein
MAKDMSERDPTQDESGSYQRELIHRLLNTPPKKRETKRDGTAEKPNPKVKQEPDQG